MSFQAHRLPYPQEPMGLNDYTLLLALGHTHYGSLPATPVQAPAIIPQAGEAAKGEGAACG